MPNPAAVTLVLSTRPRKAVQEGGGQMHREAPHLLVLTVPIFFFLGPVLSWSFTYGFRAL